MRCISAYALVVNPKSRVRLSCVAMGVTKALGFAIRAATDIAEGTELRELVGLMPRDGRARHSEVSCIQPSSEHNQSSKVQRVLFGPIRFLNHICGNPNTEVRLTLCY